MSFVKALLEDIEQKVWDIEGFLDKLREEEIVVWGTGLAGVMICEALEHLDISISFFADNNREKVGSVLCNRTVLGMESIPKSAFIIIAANVKYEIHKQLKIAFLDRYIYIDPLWLYCYKKNNVFSMLKENADAIDSVYNMLSCEISKNVYRKVLLHRAIHDIRLIWEIYDEHQYFGNDIVKEAYGNFVDCGAFQGDTLIAFLKQSKGKYNYFALEADKENYDILKKICIEKELVSVVPINIGVWDKKGQLYFQSSKTTGEVSGKIVESSYEERVIVNVDSLDSILQGEKIDFIKMDIEGAEIKALQGARNCIKENVPILAISAYHELEHLWEVPLLIKEINKDYDIYFRHHMWNMADTVCYALSK